MKILFAAIMVMSIVSCQQKYYDGEGNKIPKKAVHLLVISQYCKIDSAERAYLNKYFYAN